MAAAETAEPKAEDMAAAETAEPKAEDTAAAETEEPKAEDTAAAETAEPKAEDTAAAETAEPKAENTAAAETEEPKAEDTAAAETAAPAAAPAARRIAPDDLTGYQITDAASVTSEELTGARVYDANDKWVGEVSQLVTDDGGKITDAVVDVGGFLGLGEKPVAVQIKDLEILRKDSDRGLRVYTALVEDQLEELPEFSR